MFKGMRDDEVLLVKMGRCQYREGNHRDEFVVTRLATGEMANMCDWGQDPMFCLPMLTGPDGAFSMGNIVGISMSAMYPEVVIEDLREATDAQGNVLPMITKWWQRERPAGEHEKAAFREEAPRFTHVRVRVVTIGLERPRPEHFDPIGDRAGEIRR